MTYRASRFEQSNPADFKPINFPPPSVEYTTYINLACKSVAESCLEAKPQIDFPKVDVRQVDRFGATLIRVLADNTDVVIKNFGPVQPGERPLLRVPGSVERALDQYYGATSDLVSSDTVRRTKAEDYRSSVVRTAIGYRQNFPEVEFAGQLQRQWLGEHYNVAAMCARDVVAAYGIRIKSLEQATARTVTSDANHQRTVRRWEARVDNQTAIETLRTKSRKKNNDVI